MDALELSCIAENDQIAADMVQKAGVIARFYQAMVEGGLPTDLAATILTDWARASLQQDEFVCNCDCESCRGD